MSGPDAWDGDLAALLREVDGWAAGLARTLDELARERLEGTDATGAVRARVSGTGRLTGLDIDARGLRDLDHEGVAWAVKEAVAAARSALGDRLTELTGGPVDGATDPLAAHVERVMREG
ncbi:YbaB/EbfC family nucleoid-associated protein [Nonomuraea sp. CA-218870]|uniref:YbaB/EbfC family nucleoid-associated protein n=1 Tax=Nonomuraea sp. CA-218870 TaxID=3239998 RepID=UPI003D8C436D